MALLPLESPDFGLVTIGDTPAVSLHTPAWQCTNTYLLTDPPPRRRRNKARPGLAGKYGGRSVADEWSVELEIAVNGWWDRTGAPHADPAVGAETNWRYLLENVYEHAEDTQGRVPIGVTSAIPGGVYLGYVQLENFRREPQRDGAAVYMEVTLPSGGLIYTEV